MHCIQNGRFADEVNIFQILIVISIYVFLFHFIFIVFISIYLYYCKNIELSIHNRQIYALHILAKQGCNA